jgi:hypothetical protein
MITYKKQGEEYQMIKNGKMIGRIFKGWRRLGGEGWVCSVFGKPAFAHSYRTLKIAKWTATLIATR